MGPGVRDEFSRSASSMLIQTSSTCPTLSKKLADSSLARDRHPCVSGCRRLSFRFPFHPKNAVRTGLTFNLTWTPRAPPQSCVVEPVRRAVMTDVPVRAITPVDRRLRRSYIIIIRRRIDSKLGLP